VGLSGFAEVGLKGFAEVLLLHWSFTGERFLHDIQLAATA